MQNGTNVLWFDVSGRIRPHFVYLLLCQDDGPIFAKIGHTSNVVRRLKTLQTGTPITPRWMYYTRLWSSTPAKKLENRLHHTLAAFRTTGEWFSFSIEDKALVNRLVSAELEPFKSTGYPMTWEGFPAEPARYRQHCIDSIERTKQSWSGLERRITRRRAKELAQGALQGLTL